jgi:transcriptional regulator with XRE-family HTH domain
MDSTAILSAVIADSGMTKSAISEASGVSRSSLDDYLKGKSQPTIAQVNRIAEAAGCRVDFSIKKRLRVTEEFLSVIEFGEMFPRKDKEPLVNLGPIWRAAANRHPSHG